MELYCLPRPPLSLPRPRLRPTSRPPPSVSSSKTLYAAFKPGLHCRRATASEETSTTVSQKFEEPPAPQDAVEIGAFAAEGTQEGGERSQVGDFLSNLDVKVELDDTYYILFYGAGALLALWISSAVVSAIDSIPLFPKLMEVVGLGYSIWFSYRYLIFKENREELFSKIEDLKEQIIGRSDGE